MFFLEHSGLDLYCLPGYRPGPDCSLERSGLGLYAVRVSYTDITKICLYNFDPLKPHFYIVKLGFTGVYIIFLISAQKHRLWVLVRTASSTNEYPQSMF